MSFVGDVKTAAGLAALDAYLADNSYVQGFIPTKADESVFATLGKAPAAGAGVHVTRWYRHIASFSAAEKAQWGGQALPQASGASGTVPAAKAAAADDDDDDVDLFGSDNEEDDAEAARIRDERVAAYTAKKSKKPALIAKSSVLLDVKPWDDETDMAAMEANVRSIVMDGLLWGAAKLVPVGYGIKKLQIMSVIEDEKVSIDLLQEQIEAFEDVVQSVDIAAFNKI